MLGILEGYFVPFSQWHYTPKNHEQRVSQGLRGQKAGSQGAKNKLRGCFLIFFLLLKLDNVKVVFNLMEDIGLPQERSKPEGITFSGCGWV